MSLAETKWRRRAPALLCVALLSLILGLVGCSGGWFTAETNGTLVFSPVGERQFTISVNEMPDGGLASLSIETGDDFFAGMRDLEIEPGPGFRVGIWSWDIVNHAIKLTLTRTVGGAVSGIVATIRFVADGTPAIDTARLGTVVLGSDQNNHITGYDVVDDAAYYTR